MSDERTAFEAGFFGEQHQRVSRTGEYQLGDAAADGLLQHRAPALTPPDELTIKRRMRALARTETKAAVPGIRPVRVAAAAVLCCAAVIGISQWPGRSGCANFGPYGVVSCGSDASATLVQIEEALPIDRLLSGLRAEPAVAVPINKLARRLKAADASFWIIKVEPETASKASHGMILATRSEPEFDTVQSALATAPTTAAVAAVLAQRKARGEFDWHANAVQHTVVALVNLN